MLPEASPAINATNVIMRQAMMMQAREFVNYGYISSG